MSIAHTIKRHTNVLFTYIYILTYLLTKKLAESLWPETSIAHIIKRCTNVAFTYLLTKKLLSRSLALASSRCFNDLFDVVERQTERSGD